MGKVVSVILGSAAIVAGVIGIAVWRDAFVLGLQFSFMVIFIFGGLIAVIAGISEIKDSIAAKKEETSKKQEEKK